jgi:hypothetical protein
MIWSERPSCDDQHQSQFLAKVVRRESARPVPRGGLGGRTVDVDVGRWWWRLKVWIPKKMRATMAMAMAGVAYV